MIPYTAPILGPDPGSPPNPPESVEPTSDDVRRHACWACKLVIEFGHEAEANCAPGWEDIICMARDCLEELMRRVYESGIYIGAWGAVAEDMEAEIQQRLIGSRHENWPV